MIHIIYPIDLDCELTDKVEFKKFTIPNTPNNLPCKLDIKVYKFGIGIVDFIFDKLDINDPYTVKLSKRLSRHFSRHRPKPLFYQCKHNHPCQTQPLKFFTCSLRSAGGIFMSRARFFLSNWSSLAKQSSQFLQTEP